MTFGSISLRRWVVAVGLVTGAVGAAAAGLQPVENFTKWPKIESVAMSPTGSRLAVLTFGADGFRKLGVIDLDPIGNVRLVGGFSDADVTTVHWINDQRLVYETFQRGAIASNGSANTYAVNHDGTGQQHLISWEYEKLTEGTTRVVSRLLPYGWFLVGAVGDGSDDVFVRKEVNDAVGEFKEMQLARLNTVTRELHNLSAGMPDGTRDWKFDAQREPRMLTASVKGRDKVYWRAPGSTGWQAVADFDPLSNAAFSPWYIDSDGQVLVTSSWKSDTEGLYRFDPVAKRMDAEPLVNVRGFSLYPRAVSDMKTARLLGFHFLADRPMSYWFDEKMQRLQKGIDAALPAGRNNRLYCGNCESTRFFVIRSTSDRQPGEYFLFDRQKVSLQRTGASRPWIEESSQGRRSFHRFVARDGLSIPVYVTHPAGSEPKQALPSVLLVHGGPWARGADTDWEAEAQFLASRGYRVLEPEFRGSEGYGGNLFSAGWKQWGRAMQDDLADTVKWAADQGLIDASRVCIMGGSYGGYAALMGPIAHPGVYRCAVSFAGVTDIDFMFSLPYSDISEYARAYGYRTLIGDPDKDAEAFAKVSPLKRAGEIKVPVLVAYGTADRRVPMHQAKAFISAARSAGVDVEELPYTEAGHGFFIEAEEIDYFKHLERFLAKSLAASK